MVALVVGDFCSDPIPNSEVIAPEVIEVANSPDGLDEDAGR
jgi:hypothetical protein